MYYVVDEFNSTGMKNDSFKNISLLFYADGDMKGNRVLDMIYYETGGFGIASNTDANRHNEHWYIKGQLATFHGVPAEAVFEFFARLYAFPFVEGYKYQSKKYYVNDN